MAFKTITAKFAGTCVRCRKAGIADGSEKIAAGSKIRYGGHGQTYHLSKECPASQGNGCCSHGESESQAWARRAEEGWGPGAY